MIARGLDKQIRLCSYVIKNDKGLAPNPFWGYCTLAVCTPNHMGIKLLKGDWIVGTETTGRGNKLIYAMLVSEVLSFDKYYNDPRFAKKKPNINGTWRQLCGDNMYYRDDTGQWKQHLSVYHTLKSEIKKDLKYPYVFISDHFYYLGGNAIEVPGEFKELIWTRQGCKCDHNPSTIDDFIHWLQTAFESGVYGKPGDIEIEICDSEC